MFILLLGLLVLTANLHAAEVVFDTKTFVHGDLGAQVRYISPHGTIYSDQGWGLQQEIYADLPGILPWGFQTQLGVNFHTFPHPVTWADNFQIVATSISVQTPIVYGLQYAYDVLIQSYSGNQVPAQVNKLIFHGTGWKIFGSHYSQAFNDSIQYLDGQDFWSAQKRWTVALEIDRWFAKFESAYTDDPTPSSAKHVGHLFTTLEIGFKQPIQINDWLTIWVSSSITRAQTMLLPKVLLQTTLVRVAL